MQIAKEYEHSLFVASRKEIFDFLSKELNGKFTVILKPDNCSFSGAKAAVCMPGTAVLETYNAGVPTIAVVVTDLFTYIFGKLFFKTKYLTLPNIILGKEVVPEHIFIF